MTSFDKLKDKLNLHNANPEHDFMIEDGGVVHRVGIYFSTKSEPNKYYIVSYINSNGIGFELFRYDPTKQVHDDKTRIDLLEKYSITHHFANDAINIAKQLRPLLENHYGYRNIRCNEKCTMCDSHDKYKKSLTRMYDSMY